MRKHAAELEHRAWHRAAAHHDPALISTAARMALADRQQHERDFDVSDSRLRFRA